MEYSKRVRLLVGLLVVTLVVGILSGGVVTKIYLDHKHDQEVLELSVKYRDTLVKYNELLEDYEVVSVEASDNFSELRHCQILQLFEGEDGYVPVAP